MLNNHSSGRMAMTAFAALLVPLVANADELTTQPDMDLLALHEVCSSTAAERGMSAGEAQACAMNYLLLKLSFLPDVDLESFQALGFAERHAVNQVGYAAYRAWQEQATPRHLSADGNM